jgi:hypothetical protein
LSIKGQTLLSAIPGADRKLKPTTWHCIIKESIYALKATSCTQDGANNQNPSLLLFVINVTLISTTSSKNKSTTKDTMASAATLSKRWN